jgi:hypothetical protein
MLTARFGPVTLANCARAREKGRIATQRLAIASLFAS